MVSVISKRTGLPVLLWVTEARSLTASSGKDVTDLRADRVAAPQLAVDSHVAQRKAALIVCHLEPDAN